ncbi:hypothetical protein CfE428DRAFT_1369 [Chthoniobacter flavus Ellin428]|uniref:Glycosyltransferase 2-like domain-containing protein n=1 Tax=Chthoniobacter flavus Ellin428 TaxID=497964 RepID=B4CXS8_9BACT|nr:glycosyltransferase family 2 protein [Chthoniobacter flavus]EDY21076.1 hypothetical protein CfE428DRAFT_1369 [Chthoniobacter flavus Ellin428]TCO88798.1 hypothetical protein EV701_116170 [Chthoniobacter flavus]
MKPPAYQSPNSAQSDRPAGARDAHAILPPPRARSQPVRYLEGVTTCVNYADFLDVTLSENLHHFNEFVVVTTPDDLATQNVCSKHGVICVETNVFSKDGTHFAAGKSHAINLGLSHLKQTGWLLHLDADIALPDRFRAMLDKAALDPTCLHGADRLEVRSHDRWAQVQGDEGYARQYRYRFLLSAPELPLSPRFVHDVHGFCPLGYFQLWHSSQRRQYPYNQGGREQTDVLFATQWEPEDRRILPTVLCYHLQSEPAPLGANWHGRRTKPFTP